MVFIIDLLVKIQSNLQKQMNLEYLQRYLFSGMKSPSTNITLYWNIVSPYARAVKALIDIGKLPCKLVSVDLLSGEQNQKPFSDLNPKRQVPVLVVEEQNKNKNVITQSVAIMIYLCEKFPQRFSQYYGQNLQEKAHIMEYLSWIQFSFVHNIGILWTTKRDYVLKFKKPIPAEKIKTAERKIHRGLQQLNIALENKRFLTGDREKPSIADIMTFFLLTLLTYVGKDHFSYPNIDKFFKRIYVIREIKTITHQWFSIAKEIAQMMEKAQIIQQKAKL